MTIPEEILSLLSGSPELHAYLLARPEQLQTTDYADIITGAPIALTEKGRLLERLSEHMTHSEDAGLIRDYSACLHMALQALESKDAAFSAELWKDGEQLDGPYIAFSMEEARRAIAQYRKHWEENPAFGKELAALRRLFIFCTQSIWSSALRVSVTLPLRPSVLQAEEKVLLPAGQYLRDRCSFYRWSAG